MTKQLITKLYLDTRDSLFTTPHDASWNLRISNNDAPFHRIALKSILFANTRPLVHSSNKTLVFQEDGTATDLTATLTEGTYNANELATELKTQLDATGANTYTITYDSKTFKYTIATDGTSIKLTGDSTMLDLIGFAPQTGFTATSITSDYPVRLDGTQYVDILADFAVDCISSNGLTNVFQRIPVETSIGNLVYYEPETLDYRTIGVDSLNSLQLRLRDDRGSPFVLPATSHIQYTFVLST